MPTTAALAHRARMIVRRANQHARTPGFTPVPNRRIDKAVTIAQASIMFAAEPSAAVR